jgi:hypothetical protein
VNKGAPQPFDEDVVAPSALAVPQLALLVHAGHVPARFANRAQDTGIFGREGPI